MLRTVQWQFLTEVSGNHIGPIFKSHVVQEGTAWHLKMGPKDGPETSVRNYESLLRKIPKRWQLSTLGFTVITEKKILTHEMFPWKKRA
jgi:hypothetical protein